MYNLSKNSDTTTPCVSEDTTLQMTNDCRNRTEKTRSDPNWQCIKPDRNIESKEKQEGEKANIPFDGINKFDETSKDKDHSFADSDFPEKDNFISDIKKTHFDIYGEHLPEYLSQLLYGFDAPGDSLSPLTSKPNWYELDKFCLGQKVAIKYFINLQLSALVCVFTAYVYPSGIGPIIFTGKSCTVFKAFRRFIPHVVDMKSWYLDDIWDPKSHGFKIIDKIRKAHENIRKRMQSTDPQELKKKKTLNGHSESVCPVVWSPLYEKLREDFSADCRYQEVIEKVFSVSGKSNTYINQGDMSIMQFAFVGLFVLHPSVFGAHYVTDEELVGLLHLWRCIGYRLGIEEEYNFCNGSLAEIRQRGSDLLEQGLKPMLRFVTRDWEHIMRCTIEGVNYFGFVSFEVILLLVCEIMDLDTPKFKASMTLVQKLKYYLIRLCFSIIMRLPGGVKLSNLLFDLVVKRSTTPAGIELMRNKKYAF